jgi:hypothetical protein
MTHYPSEFQSGGLESVEPAVFFSLPPVLLAGLVLVALLAGLFGWWLGDRRRPSDDPSEHIYKAIRKSVDAAQAAQHDDVIARTRALRKTIDTHLGGVLALSGGLATLCAALDKALDGHGGHRPTESADQTPIETMVVNTRNFTLNAGHPTQGGDDSRDADHAHGESHGSQDGHGHDHGGARLDTRTQVMRLRAAVHEFADHWADRAARLGDLRAARRDLTRPPSAR